MADKPVTREEKYLAYLTGDYKGELPKPITRKEKYLYVLCLKGIGGEISPEEIKNAVNEYLKKNPVKPGATAEQAQQIEQNKTDIGSLKTETGSLKEDLSNLSDILGSEYSVISGAFVNGSGVVSEGAQYDLYCFKVVSESLISINSNTDIIYAFFTTKPTMGATSYNSSRVITSYTTVNIYIPEGITWIAVRTSSGGSVSISPKSCTISVLEDDIAKARAKTEKPSFLIGSYTAANNFIGKKLTRTSTNTNRICSSDYFIIKKGETVSVKWSPLSMMILFCNKDGLYDSTYTDWITTYTATEDVYCYINIKGSTSDIDFTDTDDLYAYYFHVFYADDSIWKNKIWYAYGTSMSDINPDGVSSNNGTMGKYPLIVDELSGLIRTNKAIGGGGICPTASHGGNVKNNIMQCPYDVDLVTIECGLNDWGTVPLGEIGDKSDNTFIGNFTQCIEYLTYNTRAKIVLITMVGTTFEDSSQTTRRNPFYKNFDNHYYRDYLDAQIKICEMYGVEVIDAQANALSDGRKNKDTIRDTIHFTDLGGQIYGRYIWSKLKNILPISKMSNNY